MLHGSGGRATGELINEIFAKEFDNDILGAMEDAAVVSLPDRGRLAMTTDSFVVTPLFFRGGDLGRLAVAGTVNDLLMRGARPLYLSCGWILEEGASIDELKKLVHSMAETCREANVRIIAGDTKVIEGHGGIYCNTTGIGAAPDEDRDISASRAQTGDAILVSGTMGDHHAAILSERLSIDTDIQSDNAPLTDMVGRLLDAGLHIHTMRDITRGGLGTVLKELAQASEKTFTIEEERIPVSPKVRDFCALLGLDPVYMGNEGKMVLILPKAEEERALDILRTSAYGKGAALIGRVSEEETPGTLVMETAIGGKRLLNVLEGEGLPRIC